MKKLFLLLIVMCSISSYGQLKIKSQDTSTTLFKNIHMAITKSGDVLYDLVVSDVRNTGSMTIHLGNNIQQAKETFNQLIEWYRTVDKKTSAVIQGKDRDLTLYKYNESIWIVTEGDGEYARGVLNDRLTEFLIGEEPRNTGLTAPRYGYIDRPAINKINKLFDKE